MPAPLTVQLNGQSRVFAELSSPTPLHLLIEALELKSDRIAVEHNGEIAPRFAWSTILVGDHDRLEIVHFVGGGKGAADALGC